MQYTIQGKGIDNKFKELDPSWKIGQDRLDFAAVTSIPKS